MSDLTFRRPLVTGGAGFIGSHLVDELLARGAEQVTVVDTYFLGKDENLGEARAAHGDRLRVHREDAADPTALAAICAAEETDIVFDLATKALLYSFFNPPGACRVNLDIALALGELLRAGTVERVVHLSSSEVYGTAQFVPMTEDHPLLAETTYAAGKAAADLALQSYARMFDVDVRIVRPFNNYGPRQNEGAFAAVVPLTIERIRAGEPPRIQGDGEQTRDFVYVGDTVDAILRLADVPALVGEVVNIGTGRETSIREIVETIAELMGWEGEIAVDAARPADVRRHCADTTKAESYVEGLAPTPLREGLARTIEWYRAAW